MSSFETTPFPRRGEWGTFPVSKGYNLKHMLYMHASATSASALTPCGEIIPPFPFNDVPIYADTAHLETFQNFWGFLVTPENVGSIIETDDIRYHVWVAAKRVVESGRIPTNDEEALVAAVLPQFLVELSLALLDLCPGPVVVFVDPRLHDNAAAMVTSATSLVAQFDKADVRRWRVIVTLPATEDGIRAADELTHKYAILTNLSLVSCLPHASACIQAGAKMLTMSVGPILQWFEQQHKSLSARSPVVTSSHPGIEVIQSCASYIHHHKLNTSLITADIRNWCELKQLNGIGGAALSKRQLEQIPMQKLATWCPRSDDTSPATLGAQEADYPSKYMETKRGFMSSLPADCRSLVSAVLYVRLGKMRVYMEAVDKVIRKEVRRRIDLQTMDLSSLYRRPAEISSRRGRSLKRTQSNSSARSPSQRGSQSEESTQLVEGVDYF